jgi:diguanylate cyclase (GGDEF)-like protein
MPTVPEKDPLTGLPGGPWLATQADALVGTLDQASFAVLLVVDIDHLRYFNLLESFAVVDDALKDVAVWLRQLALPNGQVARISGGEFALLLAVESPREAIEFAEGLRRGIAELLSPHVTPAIQSAFESLAVSNGLAQGPARLLTSCVGVVWFRGGDERSFECLVAQARARVAAAKSAGRNRVWSEPV